LPAKALAMEGQMSNVLKHSYSKRKI